MQRRRARMLAITRQLIPQIRQPGISAMLINQSRQEGTAMPLASVALDFEHGQFALKLG
jgi:hypothetical protein